ncbi:MAG: inorganic diphosphatase [Candidatus Marsarchaeota archaeon]|nr:inorganic diphosphatase [Candidatus Marsarchaeota archaeon]
MKAYIELEAGSKVKHFYSVKKKALAINTILKDSLVEPFYYAAINETKGIDGKPLHVFVLSSKHMSSGDEIDIEPIGVVYFEDKENTKNSIIAIVKYDKEYGAVIDMSQIDKRLIYALLYQIEYVIENAGTRITGFGNSAEAHKLVSNMLVK